MRPTITAALQAAVAAEQGDAAKARHSAGMVRKGDAPDPATVRRILEAMELGDWSALADDVEGVLLTLLEDGGAAAAAQLGLQAAELPAITEQVHDAGVAWARERAAELVGMRRDADGNLVPNPDARWAITEGTREALHGDVAAALQEGLSGDELAERLEDSYAFSAERASTIARTESARADVAGNMEAYAASGVVEGKQWLLGSDSCDACQEKAALGVVPLDDDFGGDGDPPLHPNCTCDVMPVVGQVGGED